MTAIDMIVAQLHLVQVINNLHADAVLRSCGTVGTVPTYLQMRDPIKICLGENEMAAVIDVFRVFEVGFRSGLLKAEVEFC